MNRKKIVGLSLLLMLLFSTNCFAKTEELKTYVDSKTISIENKENYKNGIENEILVNGVKYKLLDIKEQENKITLTRNKEEQEQKIVTTNNKYSALTSFEAVKQIEEDGYSGILELQNDSLDLEANESYIEQYKVTLTKEYFNVSENELNYIPKTIVENGVTYYLINPVWNIANTKNIDGQDIPNTYNGIMNYEGIKERRVIKSYIATVTYKGTIQKEQSDTITYELTYKEIPQEKATNYVPAIVTTTAGIIIFSGIIIFRKKNIYIYNNKNGRWKLVKKLNISKNNRLINVTPMMPMSNKYKIVLSNRLYNQLLNKNVTVKYFDKQYIYEIKEKEFEIYV